MTDNIDVDQILNDIEKPTETIIDNPAPVVDQPVAEEFTFNWNGKDIKADREKTLKWAQQGYDYAQKMAEFNKKNETLESNYQNKLREFETKYNPYIEVDNFISQNPEWWEQVQTAYQARKNGVETTDQDKLIKSLNSKIQTFEKFMTDSITEKQDSQRAQEDEALLKETQSIREQYKDLDWETPNESGQSLEAQVLKHAVDNNINTFRAAFRDFNHDRLLKLTEDRAKENFIKQNQQQNKLGLLGQTSTPTKGIKNAEGYKNKSWDELAQEALMELGSA